MNLSNPSTSAFTNGSGILFLMLSSVRMQPNGFDRDAEDLRTLQLLELAIEHAAPGPPAHPRVDRVPPTEAALQAAPPASLLRHIKGPAIDAFTLLFHYLYVRPRTDHGFGAGYALQWLVAFGGVAVFRTDSLGPLYEEST